MKTPLMQNYHLKNISVFSAMQSRMNTRTADALSAEESQDRLKNLSSVQSLREANAIKINDASISNSSGVAVMFNDPTTDNRIVLNLTKENFDRLKTKFGDKDFYERDDGAIRLSGKAEAFVSGWFGDVAYRQNYANADANKDGHISQSETKNLKNSIRSSGVHNGITAVEQHVESYASFDPLYDSHKPLTIEDALNDVITKDKNLDGHLMRLEEYQTLSEAIAEIDVAIAYSMNSRNGNTIPQQQLSPLKSSNDFEDVIKQLQLALQAMRKLQATGDINALSPEERKALQATSTIAASKADNEKLDSKDIQNMFEDVESKSLDVISQATGTPKAYLQNTLASSIDTQKGIHGDFFDANLAPVVDNIKSAIANNNVQFFEIRV